jgi:hypothetical protein
MTVADMRHETGLPSNLLKGLLLQRHAPVGKRVVWAVLMRGVSPMYQHNVMWIHKL